MNSTTEANKVLYRRFIEEVFNRGQADRVGEFLAPSYQLRDAPPGSPTGPQAVAGIVRMFRAAFPDLQIVIEEEVAEGEYVCSRTVTRGTHQGALFGVEASHRKISVPGLTMVRVVDGRLVESSVKNDMIALLKQIGATVLPQ